MECPARVAKIGRKESGQREKQSDKGYKLWEDHAQAGSRLRITTELHHLKSEVQLQEKKTEAEKMDGRS